MIRRQLISRARGVFKCDPLFAGEASWTKKDPASEGGEEDVMADDDDVIAVVTEGRSRGVGSREGVVEPCKAKAWLLSVDLAVEVEKGSLPEEVSRLSKLPLSADPDRPGSS